ncbi:Clh-6 [Aphelenchoides besseyi]|nr:Clh-6 [Aphelenchoides besseyi]KAI6210763.1 Clh-6 [Aphelenchoides besseyi]
MIQANPFAEKAAEVFLAASTTFQKLGDLTVNLNANNVDHEENRWTEKEMELFKQALERFSSDLDLVSESLLSRTKVMIRNDIKRRTLQMGADQTSQPAVRSNSRTTFKPVNSGDVSMAGDSFNASPSVVVSSVLSTIPNSQSSVRSLVTNTTTIETPGSSQNNVDIITLNDNPESPSKHEQPPELFPESTVPRESHPPSRFPTMVKRLVPVSSYANSPPQSLTIRRVPVTAATRPGQQAVRLVSKPSLVAANRQRTGVGSYSHGQQFSVTRQYTASSIPGPNISPQLIPANPRPIRQIGQTTSDFANGMVSSAKIRRSNR